METVCCSYSGCHFRQHSMDPENEWNVSTEQHFGRMVHNPHRVTGSSGVDPAPPVRSAADHPGETVIIFDWDDTLLCSSAILLQQWNPWQLQQLEKAIAGILRIAMRLGETLIVTNGKESWVQESAKRFLPRLLPTLERLTIRSARADYEKAFPGNPLMWKCQAFLTILGGIRGGLVPRDNTLNVVVLGDSPVEMAAARRAAKELGGTLLVKTVKFVESPSIAELVGELHQVALQLANIVFEGKNLDVRLNSLETPDEGLSARRGDDDY